MGMNAFDPVGGDLLTPDDSGLPRRQLAQDGGIELWRWSCSLRMASTRSICFDIKTFHHQDWKFRGSFLFLEDSKVDYRPRFCSSRLYGADSIALDHAFDCNSQMPCLLRSLIRHLVFAHTGTLLFQLPTVFKSSCA